MGPNGPRQSWQIRLGNSGKTRTTTSSEVTTGRLYPTKLNLKFILIYLKQFMKAKYCWRKTRFPQRQPFQVHRPTAAYVSVGLETSELDILQFEVNDLKYNKSSYILINVKILGAFFPDAGRPWIRDPQSDRQRYLSSSVSTGTTQPENKKIQYPSLYSYYIKYQPKISECFCSWK